LPLPIFALILFRVSGLLLAAPILASPVLPARLKAALAFALAVVVFPLVRHQAPADLTLGQAIVGGVGEVMIGATIGLALAMLVMGVEAAGLIMGHQSALALGEVINPALDEQSSITGQIYSLSFLTLFLAAGGHRAAVAALLDTYEVIPLLTYQFQESILLLLIETLTSGLILGIRLAGPVMIALFLTETALALLSRTIPQLNILTVGFSARILLSLAVAAFVFSGCGDLLLHYLDDGLAAIRAAFGLDPTVKGLNI
jgi:flagellar biosynthetic protein FliR